MEQKEAFTPWITLFHYLEAVKVRMANEIGRNVPQMANLLSIDTVHEYINLERRFQCAYSVHYKTVLD